MSNSTEPDIVDSNPIRMYPRVQFEVDAFLPAGREVLVPDGTGQAEADIIEATFMYVRNGSSALISLRARRSVPDPAGVLAWTDFDPGDVPEVLAPLLAQMEERGLRELREAAERICAIPSSS
jgi:hypothetical protein